MTLEILLKDYWSQIVLIIGAIGYLISRWLDYNYKKKELIYSSYLSELTKAVNVFVEKYTNMFMVVHEISFDLGDSKVHSGQAVKSLYNAPYTELLTAYNNLSFYLDDIEREPYRIIVHNMGYLATEISTAHETQITNPVVYNVEMRKKRHLEFINRFEPDAVILREAANTFRKKFYK